MLLINLSFLHISASAQYQYCGHLDKRSAAYFQCEQLKLLKNQEQMQREQLRILKEQNLETNRNKSPSTAELINASKLKKLEEDEIEYTRVERNLRFLKIKLSGNNRKNCDYSQSFKEFYELSNDITNIDVKNILKEIVSDLNFYKDLRLNFCSENDEKIIEYLIQEINSNNKNSIASARMLGSFSNFNFDKYFSDALINTLLNKKSDPIDVNGISITKKFIEVAPPLDIYINFFTEESNKLIVEIKKIKAIR